MCPCVQKYFSGLWILKNFSLIYAEGKPLINPTFCNLSLSWDGIMKVAISLLASNFYMVCSNFIP